MGVSAKYTRNSSFDSEMKAKERALKAEISKKASMANKRLKRLEKNSLTDLPAYRNWVDYGGGTKFSVKGKNYNELQAELSRVNKFIDNQTSTVRGSQSVLKNIANTAGINYKNVGELYSKTTNFFSLASKVQQYMDNTKGAAQAIGYQKLWTVINDYVQENDVDLSESIEDMDSMVSDLLNLTMNEYEQEVSDVMSDAFNNIW